VSVIPEIMLTKIKYFTVKSQNADARRKRNPIRSTSNVGDENDIDDKTNK
jgi:hypothetical protein